MLTSGEDRVLLRVTIPGELPDFRLAANSRKGRLHWAEQAKLIAVERERWTWLLKQFESTMRREMPFKMPVRVTFGFRFADKRHRDIDGFAAATKPLMDAMVDLAWLYGDDTKWVKSVSYEVLDDGEPRTVVTVTEAKGGR